MTTRPTYSIVAPVYNEEGNVEPFYDAVKLAMESTNEPWELLMINDGSQDGSLDLMLQISALDDRVKVINFARNFGHQVAVTAGIDYASGQAIVLIDADLQDPPSVIPSLIEKWKDGYDVVYAVRSERKGESAFKKLTAKLFYRAIHRITDINIPVDTGDFRLMDEKVANILRQMREHHRFIRGMTSWIGFRQTGVEYVREERFWGETKYPLRKMIAFALDAVTSFSFFPLQIMIYISLTLAVLSLGVGVVISLLRIAMGDEFFGGQATTIVLLLLMSSFQLFFLFIIGQYVARTYDETRDRPLYIVASTTGLEYPHTTSQRVNPQSYIVATTHGIQQTKPQEEHTEYERE